jgi:oligopeptide/dipeptide ABC transporter ATP-binding protein
VSEQDILGAHSGKDALLHVRRLRVGFAAADAPPGYAVDDVSFTVRRGATLCLVGESGCGKSVTALSIPRLLPSPPAIVAGGEIVFDGQDLVRLSEKDLRRIRGRRIGMVFQEPMTSLNPVIRVGEQIVEGLRLHTVISASKARSAAVCLLEQVGIPFASRRVDDFPHQMSGGMRQRVMIAMAMACGPSLVIADEPTTSLDVTIQRQILNLLRSLAAGDQRSLLLITHDLGLAAETADEVAVMYAGVIVEQGQAKEVLESPRHPYTQGLLRSRPGAAWAGAPLAGSGGTAGSARRLAAIPGVVPGLWNRPAGCRFHPRCSHAFDRCRREEPRAFPSGGETLCRCWLAAEGNA